MCFLWEIRQRIELREGQALFFRGGAITHNAWSMEGVGNCGDLFCHESLMRVDDERKRHGHPARPPKGVKRVKLGGTRVVKPHYLHFAEHVSSMSFMSFLHPILLPISITSTTIHIY